MLLLLTRKYSELFLIVLKVTFFNIPNGFFLQGDLLGLVTVGLGSLCLSSFIPVIN